jgi:hypothetical protein
MENRWRPIRGRMQAAHQSAKYGTMSVLQAICIGMVSAGLGSVVKIIGFATKHCFNFHWEIRVCLNQPPMF